MFLLSGGLILSQGFQFSVFPFPEHAASTRNFPLIPGFYVAPTYSDKLYFLFHLLKNIFEFLLRLLFISVVFRSHCHLRVFRVSIFVINFRFVPMSSESERCGFPDTYLMTDAKGTSLVSSQLNWAFPAL